MLATHHHPVVTSAALGRDAAAASSPSASSPTREAKMSSVSPARNKPLPQRQTSSTLAAAIERNDSFQRWRPSCRMIAPKNWMNDPCGPCYDAETGLFHLLYQYNPFGATWGNMTWMHATSHDLVHWRHIKDEPTLVPTQEHDKEGVFSGSMLTSGPRGEKGLLTIVYTAISRLPIHYTKPYTPGSEKLAFAVSRDYGQTWLTDKTSMILPGPPDHLASETASWRDPFIGEWAAMDKTLGFKPDQYMYGMISGSLRDKTPTVFLYAIDRANIAKWTFVSHLVDISLNYQLNEHAGDMGQNWEVCNFFAHKDENFLLLNVEGVDGNPKKRHAMWTKVKMHTVVPHHSKAPEPKVVPQYSGLIDHGCLYAATTFKHEPTGRRLLWGWVTEDDLAEHRYDEQGWSGCMSLPREVLTVTYDDVDVQQLLRPVFSHTFWPVMSSDHSGGKRNAMTMTTLGIRPAAEVLKLRESATHFSLASPPPAYTLPFGSRNLELLIDIAFDEVECAGEIGVIVAHNAARTAQTKVVYSPQEEMLRVDRSQSSTDPDVDRSTKTAPLGLVRRSDGTLETLRMRIFLDNSVLEIFVNDRVALTTRVYCDSPSCNLVSLYADPSLLGNDHADMPAAASFKHVEAWHGLQDAILPTGHPVDATLQD